MNEKITNILNDLSPLEKSDLFNELCSEYLREDIRFIFDERELEYCIGGSSVEETISELATDYVETHNFVDLETLEDWVTFQLYGVSAK